MYDTDRKEELSEYYSTLYSSVQSRFGKATEKYNEVIAGTPKYYDSWNGVVEDTLISMSSTWYLDKVNGEVGMAYLSERAFSDQVVYSDQLEDRNAPQE